jgi:hypothetical protein
MMKQFILLVFLTMTLFSCTEEMDKFTDVTKLRVLAIQVSPAELLPGETGEISALVAASEDRVLTRQWSWCPVPTTSLNGHECPVDEQMMRQLIAENAGVSESILPDVSPFDLGTGETARFPYIVDGGVLQLACEQVVAQFGDDLPLVPDCDGKLTTTVRLDISDGVETMTAIKQMNLLLNPNLVPNQNPEVGAVYQLTASGLSEIGATASLPGKQTANLRVAIAKDASETFETVSIETGAPVMDSENLFMTWFITGGETEFGRTSYIAGETNFEKLKQNSWDTPSAAESGGTAILYVVLQDERGGVSWTLRQVSIR